MQSFTALSATWLLLLVASASAGETPAACTHEVARITAERDFFCFPQTWLYRWDLNILPAAKLSVDAPERWVAYHDASVHAKFTQADPHERYEVELTFLSVGERTQQILIGGKTVEEKLVLPSGQILRRRWPVPPEACKDGVLEIEVRKVAGPNVVLAEIAIFSANADAKPLEPCRGPGL